MEINCRFIPYTCLYTCYITEANITEKDHVIKDFKGDHQKGKSHKDVNQVYFKNTNVNYFPQGLENHFPNLTHLIIKCGGIKEISKNDLKGLEGIVELYIFNCHLTSLPDESFTEMPNLRKVSFYGNQIEFASSDLLKPLLGRENVEVDLQRNKNIDACYSPREEDSVKSLEELMKLIDEKCIKPAQSIFPEFVNLNPRLKEMWISGKFSDLTIIAGDKKFKVHKAVLGMGNEVFAQIFEDQHEATEIRIPGFSQNSVEALLKFIYTNETSEDGNAKENFDIADKFKVAAMKTFYEKVICDQIDEENAWETFLFAHRFTSQLLKKKAFQQIAKKVPDELPEELMEYPEEFKKLIDYRKAYEEMLTKSKKLKLNKK